jgi:predicted RNase H-like HicB family nuclease
VKILDRLFGSEKSAAENVVEIPVLLRFWQDDDCWNGEAVDLPVAVFGKTFEETTRNLHEAVISHLEALQEIGKLNDTVQVLKTCARNHRVSVDEMGMNQPLVRFNAGLQNHQVVAIS